MFKSEITSLAVSAITWMTLGLFRQVDNLSSLKRRVKDDFTAGKDIELQILSMVLLRVDLFFISPSNCG
tara:strand:+ start:184 stop:390 length:207 start_codon:yes stop_codon:yes gene_type:complete